jgi:beta-glucosidase
MVGAQASAVRGGAGQSTDACYYTSHIPAMPNSDGPAGIRITQQYNDDGQDYYQFCTAFPVGTNIAQSWDTALYEAFGKAVGSEMVEYNVTTWLAPGMDMHRDPLCGRNFEYYSEDPLVAGLTAAYATLGVQSHSGIGVTLKHFWGNEQEDNRNALNNVIGERAARELYLKQFEIAVRLAKPQCMMNCYNENNGWPGSDSWDVNEDILRGEWGFTGYVMTDWGGGQSTDFIAKHGGCDMVMPGGNATTILQGYIYQEPTFAKSGAVNQLGIFTPAADGDTTYTVSAVIPGTPGNAWMGIPDGPDAPVESVEDLPASVQEGIAAGYITANIDGWNTTLTWRGNIDKDKFMEDVNRICLGDLQKSAMRILQVDLLSQDMEKIMAELDKDYTAGSYSANNNAPLATGYAPVEKSEISNVGIVAEKVAADCKVDKTVEAKVVYNGDDDLTTVRLIVKCDVPIESVEALGDNSIEFNPANGKVIVYAADGSAIADELFKINFKIDKWYKSGEYPIDLSLIEATDAEVEDVDAVVVDGAIIFDNTPLKGDVDDDGIVCNKDLILIARYLVKLIDFNEKQKIAADYNENGEINNADLILIARAIVGDCPPEYAE